MGNVLTNMTWMMTKVYVMKCLPAYQHDKWKTMHAMGTFSYQLDVYETKHTSMDISPTNMILMKNSIRNGKASYLAAWHGWKKQQYNNGKRLTQNNLIRY